MNHKRKIEFELFQENLKKEGINFYLDPEVRDDGKRLENYVFEKNGVKIKTIEKIVRRESGQCSIFVPTGSKKRGEDFTLIPLIDKEYYKQLLFLTINSFKKYEI